MNNALSNFSICDLYNNNQAIREVFISHLKTLMLHLSPIAPKSLISCSAFFTFFIPSTFSPIYRLRSFILYLLLSLLLPNRSIHAGERIIYSIFFIAIADVMKFLLKKRTALFSRSPFL